MCVVGIVRAVVPGMVVGWVCWASGLGDVGWGDVLVWFGVLCGPLPAGDVVWIGVAVGVSVVACVPAEVSAPSVVTAVGEVWDAVSVLAAERSFLRGWCVLRGVEGMLVLPDRPF